MENFAVVMKSRSRAWCITINNWTEIDMEQFGALGWRYCCFAEEEGEECGTPHIQGYMYFQNPKTGLSLHNKIPRAFLTVARGTLEENQQYTSKNGANQHRWLEYGIPPAPGVACREKIEAVMANPFANLQMYTQYRKAYREAISTEKQVHKRVLEVIHVDLKRHYYSLHDRPLVLDMEHFNNNDAVFFNYYAVPPDFLMVWTSGNGWPIKRGYEIIMVDPKYVYIVCSNEQEIRKFKQDNIECTTFDDTISFLPEED